jgi:threonine/homoserine/homoserine lactone efflux protein
MLSVHDLFLFVAAGLLLNLTPGPDTALVIGQSMRHGAKGGVLAALGISAGCFVHISAAAIGLSALLLTSALAFTVIKWIGVCYLCYVGLRMLFAQETKSSQAVGNPPKPSKSIFRQGFLTNALNPKVALFFLAFLPQFIDAGAPQKAVAFAFLGLIFNFTGTAWLLIVAWGASSTASAIRSNAKIKIWLERAIGTMWLRLANSHNGAHDYAVL